MEVASASASSAFGAKQILWFEQQGEAAEVAFEERVFLGDLRNNFV